MHFRHVWLLLLLTTLPVDPIRAGDCGSIAALQILGSGGPIADDARASSGYLLWLDDQSRVLVDAGGGVFLRFAEAGARLEALQLIAITHLHTDHAADLPALLKGAAFSPRRQPLPIAGPTGNRRFPGLEEFLQRQFNAETGAWAYLSGLLDGSDRMFRLEPRVIDHTARNSVRLLEHDGLTVHAIGIQHGPVPSLAYRFEFNDGASDRSVVISGDQNLSGDSFVDFTRAADVLVMPFAIPETAGPAARRLHALPSRIGQVAAEAGVRHLVLSHFMARSLRTLDHQLDQVRQHFPGPITLAEDRMCIALDPQPSGEQASDQ